MKAVVACSDIYAEYRKYMDDKVLAADTRLYSHGQGLDLVERPLIRQDETMVLRAGMNMTAHPSVSDETIFYIICDNVIVRDDGVEPLHRTEQRIFQASGCTGRPEERRGGNACGRTCSSRRWRTHEKITQKDILVK